MDVVAWLRGLGLERYAPAFCENDVDGEVLPELTSEDLISIGVASVGHRRRLLASIASLGDEMPAALTTISRDATAHADAERRQLTNVLRSRRVDRALVAARPRGPQRRDCRLQQDGQRSHPGP